MKSKSEILKDYEQKCALLRIQFLDNKISWDEYDKEMDNLFDFYNALLINNSS
jgi:predicted DNA-binding protein YlxM (UPF0122 family)